jgi:signal transduction histidine kinase
MIPRPSSVRTVVRMDVVARISRRTGVVANLVLALGLTGMLAIEVALTPDRPWARPIALLVGAGIGALALARERNRAWALTGGLVICAAAAAGCVVTESPAQPGVTATTALLVLGASYVRTALPRRAAGFAVAGFVVLTASRVGLRGSLILPAAMLGVIAWGVALGLGVWLRSLDGQRRAGLDGARRDERLQLARELHDAVAHHLTVIVVQSQAALMMQAKSSPRLPGTLAEIESAGGAALIAMRRVVGLLRDADDLAGSPPPEQLDELVRRFSPRVATLDLRLPEGHAAWTPELRNTVYRVTQEALTNIVRHAGEARAVRIMVDEDRAGVRIEVTDDGPRLVPGRPWSSGGGGYGLVGMRERVEALGGRFQAGPSPAGGWRVLASIPWGPA